MTVRRLLEERAERGTHRGADAVLAGAIESGPPRDRRAYVAAATAFVVAALVIGFVLIRNDEGGTPAPPAARVVFPGGECAPDAVVPIVLPESFGDEIGYADSCELYGHGRIEHPERPIPLYSDPTRSEQVAWLYWVCGIPGGIVSPGREAPACAPPGTTIPA